MTEGRKGFEFFFCIKFQTGSELAKCWHGKNVKIGILLCLRMFNDYCIKILSNLHNLELYRVITKQIITA